jgi:hypothetical protein
MSRENLVAFSSVSGYCLPSTADLALREVLLLGKEHLAMPLVPGYTTISAHVSTRDALNVASSELTGKLRRKVSQSATISILIELLPFVTDAEIIKAAEAAERKRIAAASEDISKKGR